LKKLKIQQTKILFFYHFICEMSDDEWSGPPQLWALHFTLANEDQKHPFELR
jgi:hypothetical protein